jgi:hypothetical protein
LSSLGLDLQYERPILPFLHSILSEAPLAGRSSHRIPQHFREIVPPGTPQERLARFTAETLLFIFETEPRSGLQAAVADELGKRGYVYDEETERWRTPRGQEWDTGKWVEIQPQGVNEM